MEMGINGSGMVSGTPARLLAGAGQLEDQTRFATKPQWSFDSVD